MIIFLLFLQKNWKNLEVNFDNYIKTGWRVSIANLQIDDYHPRLIVAVATGRKFWPLFSEVIHPELLLDDPALLMIEVSLQKYTFPMIDRFMSELECVLSAIYLVEIKLEKPFNHIKK